MRLISLKNTVLLFLVLVLSCASKGEENSEPEVHGERDKAVPSAGANQTEEYLALLQNKSIALVANQTSGIYNGKLKRTFVKVLASGDTLYDLKRDQTHLVDSLLSRGVNIKNVFAPEHGFRGRVDAGELVADGKDLKTGLPIVSLYGKNKKPSNAQLQGIDLVVFDIQDVGVRFYTYIATMHLVMEACAEQNIPMLILDRPNPNGHYIDGPTMLPKHTGFLGKHPIPLVHGMTIGEYAQMINGEGWLKNGIQCDITIIKNKYYDHKSFYSLPVRPSPNLPNDIAINLYPSLGLLEGTTINAGRGTEMQFQIFGDPNLPQDIYKFTYTPESNFGAKYPKHKGSECNGLDLRKTTFMSQVDLTWIIEAYQNHPDKASFFNTDNFTAHAGTPELQKQIEAGWSMDQIRDSWMLEIEGFKKTRAKYLLYE
ncbi:MAG: DUF1343 domain-containing protein [Gilvibacter sp.]